MDRTLPLLIYPRGGRGGGGLSSQLIGSACRGQDELMESSAPHPPRVHRGLSQTEQSASQRGGRTDYLLLRRPRRDSRPLRAHKQHVTRDAARRRRGDTSRPPRRARRDQSQRAGTPGRLCEVTFCEWSRIHINKEENTRWIVPKTATLHRRSCH